MPFASLGAIEHDKIRHGDDADGRIALNLIARAPDVHNMLRAGGDLVEIERYDTGGSSVECAGYRECESRRGGEGPKAR
jgi:hypothetical protein